MFSSKGVRMLATGLALCSILSTTAFAELNSSAQSSTSPPAAYAIPRWVQASDVNPGLSITGSTIKVSVLVKAKSTSAAISGTAFLEKKSGSSWTSVKSWPISATGKTLLSQSYANAGKGEYRVRVSVNVGGESISVMSGSCTL